MGCTYDVINVKLENKNYLEQFKDAFNEILADDLYDGEYENFIVREDKEGKCWVCAEDEPLFAMAEGYEITERFACEFAKLYPDMKFYMDYKCTFNNCGDAYYIEYNYDGNGIIKVKTMSAEIDGIFHCPECDAFFEDGIIYLEDYNQNETYTCPECNKEIKYDVSIEETEIKI